MKIKLFYSVLLLCILNTAYAQKIKYIYAPTYNFKYAFDQLRSGRANAAEFSVTIQSARVAYFKALTENSADLIQKSEKLKKLLYEKDLYNLLDYKLSYYRFDGKVSERVLSTLLGKVDNVYPSLIEWKFEDFAKEFLKHEYVETEGNPL